MTEENAPLQLTDDQRQQYCSLLMIGCDRDTASKYLGFTTQQLDEILQENAEFMRQALKAEGAAEFHQMKNLHEATKDAKQWRASVWWLERRAPARFARRAANAITATEWNSFLTAIVDAIVAEVTSEADRQRLIARIARLSDFSEDVGHAGPTEMAPQDGDEEILEDSQDGDL